jgi:hypothetical protein
MRAMKLIGAAILVILGSCGALVGVAVGVQAVDDWGGGRFWSVAEAETFLLPEGYEGPVTIAFAEPLGDSLPREGDARLYDFRRREVLLTPASAPVGRREPDFYYVDARGRRRHLARGPRCREEGPTPEGLYICPEWPEVSGTWQVTNDTWVVTRHLDSVYALDRLGGERATARRQALGRSR